MSLYFTEDDLRNMGPVDAQVYLEEMSWNKGWNFSVDIVKENIRDFL